MKIHENGDVTFTRNEVFIVGCGINGLYADDATTYELASAVLTTKLPCALANAGWKFFRESVEDLIAGGDVGVFTGL